MVTLHESSPCQTAAVPFQTKPRDEDVDTAIRAVVEANKQLQTRNDQRHDALVARAHAIQTALNKGATLAELADLLGVGVERVRQMAKQDK